MRTKLVFESLNSFNRKKDPLSSLGVGQIHFIRSWLDEMGVKNYTINDDLTIDVNGSVWLLNRGLTEFPSYIKFNKVSAGFSCRGNHLTSLIGCPSSVGGSFICNDNLLTSLVGCPSKISYGFYCGNNPGKFSKEDVWKYCDIDIDKIWL